MEHRNVHQEAGIGIAREIKKLSSGAAARVGQAGKMLALPVEPSADRRSSRSSREANNESGIARVSPRPWRTPGGKCRGKKARAHWLN
jgi:hypothetical protein